MVFHVKWFILNLKTWRISPGFLLSKFAYFHKRDILISDLFFYTLLMALSKQTQSWQRYYYFLLTLFILGVWALASLYGYRYYLQRQSTLLDQTITDKENQLSSLLSDANFAHYLQVHDLESKTHRIPWSDYVHRILEILETLKSVEESRWGVQLSDFKVDLEKLSLNGEVSNLRVLYGNRLWSGGLLDKFNNLDFLSDITIRKYEKSNEGSSFTFTLSANVVNNANTGSVAHQ